MLWKKDNYDILNESSPHETFGFPKERDFIQFPPVIQNFLIKTYNFSSIEQLDDIKKQLSKRKILIINARELLEGKRMPIQELKMAIDEIKRFLKRCGGSIGRIGDNLLILTPSPQVKISN